MTTAEQIMRMVQRLPEEAQREVLRFVANLTRPDQPRKAMPDLRPLDLSAWPEGCTFRREDLYGDEGR